MNYKCMILSALLLPFANSSFGKSVEARIKELEESQFKKELELSDLGAMITKKDVTLHSFDNDSQYLLRLLIDTKKAKLEAKKGGIKLSSEEETQLATQLRNSVNEFVSLVCAAAEAGNDVESIVLKGIFYENTAEVYKEVESLKFFLIYSSCERDFLAKLVKKYARCLQELTKINQELRKLTQ